MTNKSLFVSPKSAKFRETEDTSDRFSGDLVMDGPGKGECRSKINLADKTEFIQSV